MSYILEALRKSDQQRQRGATPINLATPAATPPARPPRHYRNGLLALLLLALGITIGWLRPWQPTATGAPVPAAADTMPVAPARPVPAPPPVPLVVAPAPAMNMPVPEERAPAAPTPRAPAAPPAALPAAQPAENPPLASVAPTTTAARILGLNDLPQAVRQSLPAVAIAMHAYANNPGERIVMINNQLLRQGDLVAPGLRLEEITQEGVVLGYQGYRFRHGVRQ